MRILLFGANGMLGSAVLRLLSGDDRFEVVGTVRSQSALDRIHGRYKCKLISGVDVLDSKKVNALVNQIQADYVINCVGLVKQLAEADDPLLAIPINSLFPHQLAKACKSANSRLIHISTDCVFSGKIGSYTENDFCDADDLYGRSKFLGEVNYPWAITLRTSIIGHETFGSHSLIDWFMRQEGRVKGYRHAIFSGLPTVELARVVRDYVFPNKSLCGIYHIAAKSISKYELLRLVGAEYEKDIIIDPDDELVIDRSLNANKFFLATGYKPDDWKDLIRLMHVFH